MEIGRMNRRITIQEPDGNVNADTGDPSGVWSDVVTIWAAKESVKGRERLFAGGVIALGDEVFIIRYRSNLTTNMRVFYENVSYNIMSIEELKRNEVMRLICQRLS